MSRVHKGQAIDMKAKLLNALSDDCFANEILVQVSIYFIILACRWIFSLVPQNINQNQP